ncbi:uncharacterized protein V6R79_002090 [Siganus canaliculatus]
MLLLVMYCVAVLTELSPSLTNTEWTQNYKQLLDGGVLLEDRLHLLYEQVEILDQTEICSKTNDSHFYPFTDEDECPSETIHSESETSYDSKFSFSWSSAFSSVRPTGLHDLH